ncbi:hypothetical protein DID88_006878 [Monilinia fructigena]|uniref:Ketoreductase (KR) domain-containing protein n=1 Tax=Monilinia fructigena TaxID=38457 RepID=A0A395ILX7_9HELO|nr:hypothetical protein DID88_006878 [Monilinia fructigena]
MAAKVYITGRRMEALENAAKQHSPTSGGSIIPIGACDVTSKKDLENLATELGKKEKYLSLLFAGAGISSTKAEPNSSDATELKDKLFNTETFEDWGSTYNTNVSAVYFTTAATVHLSKLMSYEFKEAGIRVNSISPGYFPSEMTVGESGGDQKSSLGAEKIQEKGHVPIQRPGSDEEMAMAVLFLSKNNYVNGEIVVVDGGVLLDLPGR